MSMLLTLEQMTQNVPLLHALFDKVRVVDPLCKTTTSFEGESTDSRENHCYSIWEKGRACENCISIRAYREKEIFFKLEYNSSGIFMVMAIPVLSGTDLVVVELIKDVSNSLVVSSMQPGAENNLLTAIEQMNLLQVKDCLTEIYNRRYIDERLPVDLLNSYAEGKPLSIFFADIDCFKKVNDMFGHVAGDAVLKEFASILQQSVEGYDAWVARYGGEEFLVVMNGLSLVSAVKLAEETRQKVEAHTFDVDGVPVRITASFGVTSNNGPADLQTEEFINRADQNMYKAKNNGRNRVETNSVY